MNPIIVRRRATTSVTPAAAAPKARKAAPEESAGELRIGTRLRHARLTKGLTLRQVAELAQCSESLVSKLESDRARPSLTLLHRIVQVLEINIGTLFTEGEDAPPVQVFAPGGRPVISVDPLRRGDGVALERLVPGARARLLQGNIHIVEPGGSSDGTIQHEGEEVGYVLEGELELVVEGVTYRLSAGWSFFFDSNLAHGYRNPGTVTTRVVWINSPATF